VQDQDSNSLTFTYNGAGLITRSPTPAGRPHFSDYTGTDLTQLRTVTGDNPPKTIIRTRYAYDTSHRLTTVTTDLTPDITNDAVTYVVSYTYEGTSKRVSTLTRPTATTSALATNKSARCSSSRLTPTPQTRPRPSLTRRHLDDRYPRPLGAGHHHCH